MNENGLVEAGCVSDNGCDGWEEKVAAVGGVAVVICVFCVCAGIVLVFWTTGRSLWNPLKGFEGD